MTTASPGSAGPAIAPEDALRAGHYTFLSRLLGHQPDARVIALVAAMQGDDTALGQAYRAMARTAAATTPEAVAREFFDLFVGVGRGELLPYASFYQTGFLNERPLATLRADLARLGVERAAGRHEPEDHIAFVCEVMAGLLTGAIAPQPDLDDRAFHGRHIAPWAAQFFDDLAVAPSARFYRPLAEIGRIFVDIEARGFALAD